MQGYVLTDRQNVTVVKRHLFILYKGIHNAHVFGCYINERSRFF